MRRRKPPLATSEKDVVNLLALIAATRRVWKAFLAYGPVDDGTQLGLEFGQALDALAEFLPLERKRK